MRSGAWKRIRYGVYTTGAVWRQHEVEGRAHRLECAAALRRLDRTSAAVSHTSAARLHGLVLPQRAEAGVRLTTRTSSAPGAGTGSARPPCRRPTSSASTGCR
ncbi:hypothetical protein A7K94_0205950 [Modestobacter sp. VKM Ac-2676]|nr:hypothetical protein A7K94_0205950 [Modestobacter sp. VKM Ac-2676]